MSDAQYLTRKDFDDVIRRTTELSVDDPDAEESRLDENDLFRIAEEIGLSEIHVRRAREAWRRKRYEIVQEVEGILDKLEAGEPLKPPPPRWRRWIQNQLMDLG